MPVSPETGLQPFQARRLAFELGFTGDQVGKAEKIMMALSKVFLDKDATPRRDQPAGDHQEGRRGRARRQDRLRRQRPVPPQGHRRTARPDRGEPGRGAGRRRRIELHQLDGNIGCLVNGAGLAMGTMDIIKYHGGDPANFLDVGGGVTAEGAVEAFRIILSDPKVKGILVNIFGGIAKCATIAEALVKAGREVGFKVPVVVRLEGNEVEKARQILQKAATELPTLKTAPDLTAAAKLVVELSK